LATVLSGILLSNPSVVFAEIFTDPMGDLFDASGNSVVAEKYPDITEVGLLSIGAAYVANLKMADSLPTSVSGSVSIE